MSDNLATPVHSDLDTTIPPASAAMIVLAEAEVIAGSIRAEADHYARQRESEADLLVQKARRVLEAAEAKAAVIVAAARVVVDSIAEVTIDLDAAAPTGVAGEPSELDRMLDDAIETAVADALKDG